MTTEIDAALDEGAKPPSPAQTGRPQPPRGMQRWLARLPLGLNRAGLGGLLGQRFLMLTHTGRKSGQRRHVVLEVVRYDKVTSTIIIVSGFGVAADWFRNISRHPKVTVHIGGRQFSASAEQLSREAAVEELKDYRRRHPQTLKALARSLSYPWDGTEASYQTLAQSLPVLSLRPLDK